MSVPARTATGSAPQLHATVRVHLTNVVFSQSSINYVPMDSYQHPNVNEMRKTNATGELVSVSRRHVMKVMCWSGNARHVVVMATDGSAQMTSVHHQSVTQVM